MTDIRKTLCDMGYEDSIVFDNPEYDNAIIGISSNGNVIYSYEKMVDKLVESDGMTVEEAEDFIGYNTLGALPNYKENAPIVMYDIGTLI